MSEESFISKVTPLTQQQRIEAREKAREATISNIGKAPKREDYATRQYGRFPREVRLGIMGLIVIVLIAAFVLSAMRLYSIGNSEFHKTIPDANSAIAAGIFIILLAEASTVLFMIAISVIGDSLISKGIMLALAILATLIALFGNYYVALNGQETNIFSWLEALSPPIITIGTSFVLERFIFGMIEQRHKDQINFDTAFKVYQEKASNPEINDYFPQAYANAIFDKLLSHNKDRRRKHEGIPLPDVLAQLPPDQKNILVQREISADTWFYPVKEEKKEDKPRAPEVAHNVGFLSRQPLPVNQSEESYLN